MPIIIHCLFLYYRGRDRYVNEEFDLDLTYITERIIGVCVCVCVCVESICSCSNYLYPAMSFPASGVESAYRNNLKDVAKMLKTKHQENYMVSSQSLSYPHRNTCTYTLTHSHRSSIYQKGATTFLVSITKSLTLVGPTT